MMNKNKFAVTPPMGWNSYDYYDTTVKEAQVKENADFMAAHLKEFGWEYVVVDIEWYSNDAGTRRKDFQYIPFGDDVMDEWGRLQPSPIRFPSSAGGKGFAELAGYVHDLGLKFGIHIMRGIPRRAAELHLSVKGTQYTADMVADPSSICIWNPDMYGVRNTEAGQAYYDSVIEMYAAWGVDFIKCDDICDSRLYREERFSGWDEIEMLHKAIQKAGRPIVLSLSPGPAHIDRSWHYCRYANMWRITDDFWDDWELLKNMFWRCELWQDHVKEGCFPDCDMLPLGKVGGGFETGERDCQLTREEQKTMMTLWCMFRSPLMIGAELTKLDDWTLSLLTNKDLLALLQEHCRGEQLFRNEHFVVWMNTNCKTGERCIALFNLEDQERETALSITELPAGEELSVCELTELWDKERQQVTDGVIRTVLPAHGCRVYRMERS